MIKYLPGVVFSCCMSNLFLIHHKEVVVLKLLLRNPGTVCSLKADRKRFSVMFQRSILWIWMIQFPVIWLLRYDSDSLCFHLVVWVPGSLRVGRAETVRQASNLWAIGLNVFHRFLDLRWLHILVGLALHLFPVDQQLRCCNVQLQSSQDIGSIRWHIKQMQYCHCQCHHSASWRWMELPSW